MRLFCFPYAGGGASIFRKWAAHLSPGVELVAIRYPGRESRLRDPHHADLVTLSRAIADDLGELFDVPYAVFGHSMGATIAFEVARSRREMGAAIPEHLFVSGARGPRVPDREPPMRDLDDEEFLVELQLRYGDLASVLSDDPQLRALFLPCLRADIAMNETYEYQEGEPLACPITAFSGTADASVFPAEAAEWRRESGGAFRGIALAGGHFFLEQHLTTLCRVLAAECDRALGGLR